MLLRDLRCKPSMTEFDCRAECSMFDVQGRTAAVRVHLGCR